MKVTVVGIGITEINDSLPLKGACRETMEYNREDEIMTHPPLDDEEEDSKRAITA